MILEGKEMPKFESPRLVLQLANRPVMTHFSLYEFASGKNHDGPVMVHAALLWACECTRRKASVLVGEEVYMKITGGCRTEEDAKRLAVKYGWIAEGGSVSRRSMHNIPENPGIAVDFYLFRKKGNIRIPVDLCVKAASDFFRYLKHDYKDGHIHGDMRDVWSEWDGTATDPAEILDIEDGVLY